jgi:hypothetical protein
MKANPYLYFLKNPNNIAFILLIKPNIHLILNFKVRIIKCKRLLKRLLKNIKYNSLSLLL